MADESGTPCTAGTAALAPEVEEGTPRLLEAVAVIGRLIADYTGLGLCYTPPMTIEFNGTIWFWRGPAPWYFVTISAEQCRDLQAISGFVTYGWGVIPVTVRIGKIEWKTSLFPKDGRYLVPIKASIREAEHLAEGDDVRVRLDVRADRHHGGVDQAM